MDHFGKFSAVSEGNMNHKLARRPVYGMVILFVWLTLGLTRPGLATVNDPDDEQIYPPVLINEIRVDQPGNDNDEYFELHGSSGTSLDDLTYLVVGDGPGGSGVIEAVISLDGKVISGDGFFLVAKNSFALFSIIPDFIISDGSLNFENEDNVTHLLVGGFTGSSGQDLDNDDDGQLDVLPWVAILDSVSLAKSVAVPPAGTEWAYSLLVGPDGTTSPAHIYRFPDGNTLINSPAGNWNIGKADPASGDDTPGTANNSPLAISLLAMGSRPGLPLWLPWLIAGLLLTLLLGLIPAGNRPK